MSIRRTDDCPAVAICVALILLVAMALVGLSTGQAILELNRQVVAEHYQLLKAIQSTALYCDGTR